MSNPNQPEHPPVLIIGLVIVMLLLVIGVGLGVIYWLLGWHCFIVAVLTVVGIMIAWACIGFKFGA